MDKKQMMENGGAVLCSVQWLFLSMIWQLDFLVANFSWSILHSTSKHTRRQTIELTTVMGRLRWRDYSLNVQIEPDYSRKTEEMMTKKAKTQKRNQKQRKKQDEEHRFVCTGDLNSYTWAGFSAPMTTMIFCMNTVNETAKRRVWFSINDWTEEEKTETTKIEVLTHKKFMVNLRRKRGRNSFGTNDNHHLLEIDSKRICFETKS